MTPQRKRKPCPVRPAKAQRHPRLTKNRHVNEHLSFCAMHALNAKKRKVSAATRAAHREAAALHMLQAARHFRTRR